MVSEANEKVMAEVQATDASVWPCLKGTISETELERFVEQMMMAEQSGEKNGVVNC